MSKSPVVQRFITRLAEQHAFSLSPAETPPHEPLIVEQDSLMPLIVAIAGPNSIEVTTFLKARYAKQADYTHKNTDAGAFFDIGPDGWSLVGWRTPAEPPQQQALREAFGIVPVYRASEYDSMAKFWDELAAQWEREGRLERGRRREAR